MTIYAKPGESIYCAADRVISHLHINHATSTTLVFNGISVAVGVDSSPADIATIYNLKMHIVEVRGVPVAASPVSEANDLD